MFQLSINEKNRVQVTEAWIDVERHWIWAIQPGNMEGAGTVLIGRVQAKIHVLCEADE